VVFQVTPGMRRLGASVLGMEAIVVALTIPVALRSGAEPSVAVAVGAGLAVLCVLVAALLKRPVAFIVGTAPLGCLGLS